MRTAAVDLGTNSTRYLVADVTDTAVREVERGEQITGLGEGVDARGKLLPLPIARVRNALSGFRRRIEELGAERALAVGTSAVRDADNGEAFLGEVEWSYGFKTRLLSGEDEARLTFRGATLGRETEGVLVVDIGGGSTELVTRDSALSLDVGSVRMKERFGEAVEAIGIYLRPQLPDIEPQGVIGVAGTITSLAALDLDLDEYDPERVHGHVLTLDGLEAQLERLAGLSVDERAALPALQPGRAPFIVTGAAILREILRRYGFDGIEASERDLLDAVALEAAALPEPVEGDAPPGAYTCC